MFNSHPIQQLQVGKYYIEREIGSGGFATVYLARHCKTGEKVAIKVIERQAATENGLVQYVEQELRIAAKLNHPSIAKVHDIIYSNEYIYIIMEYLENGSLQMFIENQCYFTQADQIRIALEILEALNYMHERGISHRDIKPANVLFDKDMHAKLIDFGFSKEFRTGQCKTVCGTQELMSPEIICNKDYDAMKADIWAYGVTIHMMATLSFPFEYKSEAQFIHCVKTNSIHFNIKIQGVIGWLAKNSLAYNPSDRLKAKEMLEYIKSQTSDASPNSLAKIVIVRRANTSAHIARVRVHPNTPVIFKARVINDGNPLKILDQRKQIKSLEH